LTAIGLIPHTGKPEALALTRQLMDALTARNVHFLLEPEAGELLGHDASVRVLSQWSGVTLAMVLGGDGALLRAARHLAPLGVPLLGVNFGHFGFLTEVEARAADELVDYVLSVPYTIEPRMMLRVRLFRDDVCLVDGVALNDAVVSRGTMARVLHVGTRSDGEEVLSFTGDGVIVATPTGSTAYSLSAGGPIINPLLECIVLTPICPHALAARSVVMRSEERLDIEVDATHDDIMLTIDGQEGYPMRPGDRLHVTRAPWHTRLVRLRERSFYKVLRSRMSERPI